MKTVSIVIKYSGYWETSPRIHQIYADENKAIEYSKNWNKRLTRAKKLAEFLINQEDKWIKDDYGYSDKYNHPNWMRYTKVLEEMDSKVETYNLIE